MSAQSKSFGKLFKVSGARCIAPYLLCVLFLVHSSPALAQGNSSPDRFWMLDLNIEAPRIISGEWFEAGSFIDIEYINNRQRDSEYIEVFLIGPSGERVYDRIKRNPYPITEWPWNAAERNLACNESYSRGTQAWYVLLAVLALPMSILPFFAAKGTGDTGRYWWFIASFFVLVNEWNMVQAPSYLNASAEDCKQARKVVAAHTIYDSTGTLQMLPIHAAEAAPIRRLPQHLRNANVLSSNATWQAILLLLLSSQIPAAISGMHYLFVKHPVEPFLETDSLEDSIPLDDVYDVLSKPSGSPRQVFVEENQARRIEAQTKRIEAEANLAEALLKRERSRASWKRTKKD